MKIQEIAKLTGVSPSTVSRVFSHHPNIREDVRERVFAVAKQYSYHPRLSTKQRNVVIITPYESIYPVQCCVEMLLMALTHELPRHGFRLEILPQDNLGRLDSIQFCAAVAIGAEPREFKDWEKRFSVPLVIVDRNAEKDYPGVWLVRSDEEQAMELAVAHLQERGCKKIGCIVHGAPGTGNADIRYQAVRKSMLSHGFPADETMVYYSSDEQYVEIIGKLLRRGIDGLFCPGGKRGNHCGVCAFAVFPAGSGRRFADCVGTDFLLPLRSSAADDDFAGLQGACRFRRRSDRGMDRKCEISAPDDSSLYPQPTGKREVMRNSA